MIFKGSLTQCVIRAADQFRQFGTPLLGIIANPKAKYYTVEDSHSLGDYNLDGVHRHLRLVFFGTFRELNTFANSKHEQDLFCTENGNAVDTPAAAQDESGDQATPQS